MKIKALRVADVGPFRDPVAVEGFSGGLDVLAGPNELGKSTLFRAIRTVFTMRHTSSGRAVEEMASRGGARTPVIEADFEVHGQLWRITKTFGRKKSADLTDLATGRVSARGPDAEEQLAQLVGGGSGDAGAGRFGLLWVGQQHSLHPPTPDFDPERRKISATRGERATLQSAVAAEVDTVAGGALARAIAARVAEELHTYLQPKRRLPRAGSRYEAALKERQALTEKRRHLRAEQDKATARLDRLDAAVREQAVRASPALVADLGRAEAGARQVLADAEKLAGALAIAEGREAKAQLAHRQAAGVLEQYEAALLEVRSLGVELTGLDARRAELAADRETHADALGAIDQAIAAEEARRKRLDELAEQWRDIERSRQSVEVLGAALSRVRVLHDEAGKLQAELAVNPASPARMRTLAEASQALAVAAERARRPAAVDLRFALEAAAVARVRVNGQPATQSGRIGIDQAVRLEIDGIGVFEIVPADAAERARMQAEVEEAKRALAEIEATLGATSGAAAQALADARQALADRLGQVNARLAAEAPDGIEAIEAALLDARARLGTLESAVAASDAMAGVSGEGDEGALLHGDGGAGARAALTARLDELRKRRDRQRTALEEAGFAMARCAERGDEIKQRLDVLVQRLGPETERAGERKRLAEAAQAALDVLGSATRERVLLAASAPSADALADLKSRHDAAAAALEAAEAAATRLGQEIAMLEGEVRAAGEAEIGPEIARLDGEIIALDAEISQHEHAIAALELLQETLAQVAAENRSRFLQPVMKRLQPYLAQMFADADVVLNEDFGLEMLRRGGTGEPIDLLSDGTREQLAVLVRLGFGRLLAETDMAAPVILDDALVYSDDERIGRMFGVLQQAAEHHQVIVFTCRSAAFAALAGTRLSLEPWQGG